MDTYFNPSDYEKTTMDLENKIKYLKEWIWGNDITSNNINQWIENFKGLYDHDLEREQINARYLLSQFMYFSQREIRLLLVAVYRDLYYKPLISTIRNADKSISLNNLQSVMNKKLKSTRFLGVGNSSESSCLLLYYFRQMNEIPIEYFMDNCEIFTYDESGNICGLKKDENGNEIEYYIFLDDISATGRQAKKHFNNIHYEKILTFNPNAKIYYYTLFRTVDAYNFLEEHIPEITTKTIFELDNTYKTYGEESRHFIQNDNFPDLHTQEKEYNKGVCKKYMESKVEKYELCGFLDSQLMLSFFYNTPNNTLPIFWVNKGTEWQALFKRFSKEIERII